MPDKKPCCPICKQEYVTQNQADQCPIKNGVPKAPKYKKDQLLLIVNDYFPNGINGQIVNFAYTKPDQPGRKPHQPVYLLRIQVDQYTGSTTAAEDELFSPKKEEDQPEEVIELQEEIT